MSGDRCGASRHRQIAAVRPVNVWAAVLGLAAEGPVDCHHGSRQSARIGGACRSFHVRQNVRDERTARLIEDRPWSP